MPRRVIKPRNLKVGDHIAIVSPSWGGPAVFPHIYEHGLDILRTKFQLHVYEMEHTRADPILLYEHPEYRAADVNAAFEDPSIDGIICSIGGDDSVRILPFLNAKTIRNNPKVILGYSDATTLLFFCHKEGLVTFHGPSIMAGFSQLSALPLTFQEHVSSFLFTSWNKFLYDPYPMYSEGYPDWADHANLGKVNTFLPNDDGWHWLHGTGTVRGRLLVGNIEVMEFLKGTEFWLPASSEFWSNRILAIETSEEKPTPSQVKYMLRNYGMQGILQKLQALLVGRCRGYTPNEKIDLEKAILDVIIREFHLSIPIITNLDFGHTDPQWILPIGVTAEINCEKRIFQLCESSFTNQ